LALANRIKPPLTRLGLFWLFGWVIEPPKSASDGRNIGADAPKDEL
jgi:hypothetical protein